MILGKKEFRI